MRITFIDTLTALAAHDDRIVLLTGDLGYLVVERFAERHPNRFFNVGVAEQNMIGLATGLAESGFVPFAYSIAPFALLRPFEFIRNGPVLHQFPVRIVGVGGGVEYIVPVRRSPQVQEQRLVRPCTVKHLDVAQRTFPCGERQRGHRAVGIHPGDQADVVLRVVEATKPLLYGTVFVLLGLTGFAVSQP